MSCTTVRNGPLYGTPDSDPSNRAVTWSTSSHPMIQTRLLRRARTPPWVGSSHARAYMRWSAREKLDAEANETTKPMTPVCACRACRVSAISRTGSMTSSRRPTTSRICRSRSSTQA